MQMVEVLRALDLDLPHNGKINCPLHPDKTASCHIYEDHFHCYGCGEGGDAIALVKKFYGCSYGRAIQFLAKETDIDPEDVPEHVRKNLAKQPEREWLDLTGKFVDATEGILELPSTARADAEAFAQLRWGVTLETLFEFGVRVGKFSFHAPHYRAGQVVGVKIRSYSGAKSAYDGSRFTAQLYRPRGWTILGDNWYGWSYPAILVEGESDCWVMHQQVSAPETAAAAVVYALPSGASTWRDEWGEQLARHPRVILCMDSDEAGMNARRKIQSDLLQRKLGLSVINLHVPFGLKDTAEAVKSGWNVHGDLVRRGWL
jgi:hypothetical protein